MKAYFLGFLALLGLLICIAAGVAAGHFHGVAVTLEKAPKTVAPSNCVPIIEG